MRADDAPRVPVAYAPIVRDPTALTVCLGSCFAESFVDELRAMGFAVFHRRETCNHFNPASLADMLDGQLRERPLETGDVFGSAFVGQAVPVYTTPFRRGLYGLTSEAVLERSLELDAEMLGAIERAEVVILTLGMADVLRLNADGRVLCAANKISPDLYAVDMLSDRDAAEALERVHATLACIRGGRSCELVVTLSPQRYFWDAQVVDGGGGGCRDLMRNFTSKRTLRNAIDMLRVRAPQVHYFPSFEIATEELRGVEPLFDAGKYTHVSESTVSYAFSRFVEACFSPPARAFARDWKRLARLRRMAREHPALAPAIREQLRRLAAELECDSAHEAVRDETGRLLHELGSAQVAP